MSTSSRVLIIKLGYSETLVDEVSLVPSIGDVLRSTVILPRFAPGSVTWLTDIQAVPLLEGHPMIDRLMTYDLTTCFQLQAEHFDTIINLEKVPGVCAFADTIKAWRRYGFRFENGEVLAYDNAHHILSELRAGGGELRRKYWEEFLFEMIGMKWDGERPTLGHIPQVKEMFDYGLNYRVGSKFPEKAWPRDRWNELYHYINDRTEQFASWQQGEKDLYDYIRWIASCKTLITNDSLGIHIAEALGKKIIALFGPTRHEEIFISNGRKIQADKMDHISVETVVNAIQNQTT